MPPRRLSDEQARELAPHVRRLIGARFRWVPDHLASHDDLFQCAMLAIMRAAPRFDAARGMTFDSWAMSKAYFGIQDALRALAPGSRSRNAPAYISLDEPLRGAEDVTRADLLEDESFEFPDPLMPAAIRRAMADLTLDEQSAIELHFDEDLSQREIGEMMGITESRVCQIVNRGLGKLRRHPALAA